MTRRMDRVNVLLRQEISRVLTTGIKDPRITSIVSVTQVDASPDLRNARVGVSVLGDEAQKQSTLKALRSASGFIHREMRGKLSLRSMPSLDFYVDDSIERGAELLEKIMELSPGPEEPGPEADVEP